VTLGVPVVLAGVGVRDGEKLLVLDATLDELAGLKVEGNESLPESSSPDPVPVGSNDGTVNVGTLKSNPVLVATRQFPPRDGLHMYPTSQHPPYEHLGPAPHGTSQTARPDE